jgi:transposase
LTWARNSSSPEFCQEAQRPSRSRLEGIAPRGRTCDLPEPEDEPVDPIGVDRGIVNLAARSDGTNYQSRRLTCHRRWQARKRAELQVEQTRSAIRRLARRPCRGHTERANRLTRDRFSRRRCGLAEPADVVAGVKVRNRARSAWVVVTAPVPAPARPGQYGMRPVTVPS